MKRKIVVALAALGMLGAMSACSLTGDEVTDPSMQTLRYEGGDTGGSKFKECVEPGSKMVSNDKFYSYPNTQREDVWDTNNYNGSGSDSADHEDLVLTDKNGVTVNAKVKVSFFLNTDCTPVEVDGKKYPGGTLQVFHEKIGKTRGAYFDAKKEGNDAYSAGWLWAMDNYISNPVIDNLSVQAKTLTADDMWLKQSVKTEMEKNLADALPDLINEGMESDLEFYKVASVKIYSLTPSEDYLGLYKERQAAQVKAQTAEANKKARIAEAEANAAVARSEADIKRAEIAGYGSVEAYLRHEAIEAGMNPFQPTTNGLIGQQ
jgi:hypothetical protein